uniref:Uncharacterized protein n=1 Tax=Toxoplasma gondii COUG TaxID=1074873 RepID=A0A2G8XLH5_TOXGO|nr:hypothetical protein TGCOUG_310055 [Toxoplasma gondii COUG]
MPVTSTNLSATFMKLSGRLHMNCHISGTPNVANESHRPPAAQGKIAYLPYGRKYEDFTLIFPGTCFVVKQKVDWTCSSLPRMNTVRGPQTA